MKEYYIQHALYNRIKKRNIKKLQIFIIYNVLFYLHERDSVF